MAKNTSEKDAMDIVRQRFCAISLSEKVNARTYIHLVKHGLVKGRIAVGDATSIQRAFAETHSLCDVPGPFLFHGPDPGKAALNAVSISHAILNSRQTVRQAAVEYLLQAEMADYISSHTIAKIMEVREAVLSRYRRKWVPAAAELSDILEDDWLLNYQGVLQAVRMNFDAVIAQYLTKLMRPNTSSLGSMGRGILTPSQSQDEIKERIQKIVAEVLGFNSALEKYYMNFGHVPLAADVSVCALYEKWVSAKGSVDNIWQVLWEWADSGASPLRRYHVCHFFAKKPKLIPDNDREQFVREVVAIICSAEEEGGQWHNLWLIRCVLARYYCQYLECRLPGANSEKIATQSWWLADKMVAIYGNNPADVKGFLEVTVEPEESRMSLVWQLTRLAPEPSALRYTTLYVANMWSLSLVSQLSGDALKILLSTATEPQKERIDSAVAGSLVSLFPIRRPEDKLVFGFDQGCIDTARTFVKLCDDDEKRDMLQALIESVVKLTTEAALEESLKRLPEGNPADQVFSSHALQILANSNRAPTEFVWNCLVDKDWITRVFTSMKRECAEYLFQSLYEIQLRMNGKWNEQLPHLYAILCGELHEDEEKRKMLFAFTVVSSLAANSVSAVDRLLKGDHKFDHQKEVEDWRGKIDYAASQVPEWCRARLRAMLASLHV